MRRDQPTVFRPDLRAAVPAAVVKSAIGAAILAGAVWLLVHSVHAQLAAILFAVLTLAFAALAVGNVRSREYAFHDDHVEVREGFLTVTRDDIPYDRVTDLGFTKSVWQRAFGVGTVTVNTAGSDTNEIAISDVADPESVYDEIKANVSGR